MRRCRVFEERYNRWNYVIPGQTWKNGEVWSFDVYADSCPRVVGVSYLPSHLFAVLFACCLSFFGTCACTATWVTCFARTLLGPCRAARRKNSGMLFALDQEPHVVREDRVGL